MFRPFSLPTLAVAATLAAAVLLLPNASHAQSGAKAPTPSQAPKRGIIDQQAPEWAVDQWYQLPAGKSALSVQDYKGKVVYAYFFQSWCPGCHSRGFPALKEVQSQFAGDDDVAFVVIQTVFEGKTTNTSQRALATARKFKLDVPVGHAVTSGPDHTSPQIMKQYRTGGTPWTVIIDKDGIVRANDFTIDPQASVKLINQLKAR